MNNDVALAEPDERTAACRAVALLIAANKPLYPLMLFALIGGDAAWRSLPTLASLPFFAAIPWLARRSGFWARVALPVVGTLDTAFAAKVLGADTGSEFFFAACALLPVVSFARAERTAARILVVFVYLVFAALHGRYGVALAPSPAGEAASLLTLNAYATGSLFVFIALRFSFGPRDGAG